MGNIVQISSFPIFNYMIENIYLLFLFLYRCIPGKTNTTALMVNVTFSSSLVFHRGVQGVSSDGPWRARFRGLTIGFMDITSLFGNVPLRSDDL